MPSDANAKQRENLRAAINLAKSSDSLTQVKSVQMEKRDWNQPELFGFGAEKITGWPRSRWDFYKLTRVFVSIKYEIICDILQVINVVFAIANQK